MYVIKKIIQVYFCLFCLFTLNCCLGSEELTDLSIRAKKDTIFIFAGQRSRVHFNLLKNPEKRINIGFQI